MDKKILLCIFLLITTELYSQENFYINWEQPNNFLKYNLSNVSIYEFKIKKNGKIKKDSVLLRKYKYDKQNSIIKGINHNWFYINHGVGSHMMFYRFKNQYIKDSLLINKIIIYASKDKIKKNEIENNLSVENFEYDSLNNLTKKSFYSITENGFIYRKDTIIDSKVIHPKIIEYKYDSKNRKIKEFILTDSTEYFSRFDMKSEFESSKSCVQCQEKYLSQEWKYENDKLTEWINYTYKKRKHTKRNYFYNENSNLKKQIDSSGWSFSNEKAYLDSTTEITYNENGKKIISLVNRDKFPEKHYIKKVVSYNKKNQIIKKENYSENQTDIHEYFYENSKLVYATSKYGEGNIIKYEYFYDKNGLIKEQKHYIDEKLVGIERYYYN